MYILDVTTEIPAEVDEQLDMVSDFVMVFRLIRIKLNGIKENEWMELTWKYLKWSFKSKFSPRLGKIWDAKGLV